MEIYLQEAETPVEETPVEETVEEVVDDAPAEEEIPAEGE